MQPTIRFAVAGEDGELFGDFRVPNAHGLVERGSETRRPRAKTRRTTRNRHDRKARERLGRVCVPDPRGLVGGGSDDASPIGRKFGGADRHVMSGRMAVCLPVVASQMRTLLSLEAVTMRCPSGEKAALRTFPSSLSAGRPSP